MQNNFDNYLFRCSSLGHLMTEPKGKSETLSETTKTHLIDCYVGKIYDRKTEIISKFLDKGISCEEDSITLLSRVKKIFYKKNDVRLSNEFITGEPDLFNGENIYNAELIVDCKTSWDIFTYFRAINKPLISNYYWQMQGYMLLTNAKTSSVAYCLVNTPEVLIKKEQNNLFYKSGADVESHAYLDACKEIERNMTFNDIPLKDRLFEFTVDRNDEDIERLKDRIKDCRIHLNSMIIEL